MRYIWCISWFDGDCGNAMLGIVVRIPIMWTYHTFFGHIMLICMEDISPYFTHLIRSGFVWNCGTPPFLAIVIGKIMIWNGGVPWVSQLFQTTSLCWQLLRPLGLDENSRRGFGSSEARKFKSGHLLKGRPWPPPSATFFEDLKMATIREGLAKK